MKFNMDQDLKSYDGKDITKSDTDKDCATLGEVLEVSCVNANPQKHGSGDAKWKIYKLLQTIAVGGLVELTADQVTTLKDLVGDAYNVTIVGCVWELLENPVADSGKNV